MEIKINKTTKINKGGLITKDGLLQPEKFRVFTYDFKWQPKRKYINIQGVCGDRVVFNLDFFVGSYKKAQEIKKQIMEMFGLDALTQ